MRALCAYWSVLFLVEWIRTAAFARSGIISPLPPLQVLAAAATGIASWALLCVWAFVLTGHLPFHGPRRWGHLAALVVAGSVSVAVRDVFHYHAAPVLGLPMRADLAGFVTRAHHMKLLMFLALAAVGYAVDHLRRARDAELARAEVELELAESRLNALACQLQPHVVFASLDAISAALRDDPAAADRMLARLGHLLRTALGSRDDLVPLGEEATFLERYLETERLRARAGFRTSVEIAPAAREVPVPHDLLRPLVEIAVHRAASSRRAGGSVEIRGFTVGSTLVLTVRGDGPPPDAAEATADEVVAGARAWLARLYGETAALEAERTPSRVRATLRVPTSTPSPHPPEAG